MNPTPEAIATEQLHISTVQVLVIARRSMAEASDNGEGVQSWRRFCAWLESRLPAGTVVDDPQLSPAANARFLAEAHGITAADVLPDTDGLRSPDAPPLASVTDLDQQDERP